MKDAVDEYGHPLFHADQPNVLLNETRNFHILAPAPAPAPPAPAPKINEFEPDR